MCPVTGEAADLRIGYVGIRNGRLEGSDVFEGKWVVPVIDHGVPIRGYCKVGRMANPVDSIGRASRDGFFVEVRMAVGAELVHPHTYVRTVNIMFIACTAVPAEPFMRLSIAAIETIRPVRASRSNPTSQ